MQLTQDRGMSDAGRDTVGPMVLEAWDAFLEQAAAVDLDRPTRLPGWRVDEGCVDPGLWGDHAALADLGAAARAGGGGAPAGGRGTQHAGSSGARGAPPG